LHYTMVTHVFDIGLFFKMIGLYILQFIVLLPAVILIVLPEIIQTIFVPSPGGIFKLITAVVYILAIILMFFLLMRMYLTRALVIDQKINPWRAMKLSFRATKSKVWRLIGLTIVNAVILIISMIPIGIGLIWTLPY